MTIIKPYVEILTPLDGDAVLRHIERCGRVCYQSEDKIKDGSAAQFVNGIIKRGHESVLEHYSFTVKFVVDRGVSHEIVRHRIASFSQTSTRYVNYASIKNKRAIPVIKPFFLEDGSVAYEEWKAAVRRAEEAYFWMIDQGRKPEEARDVLPTSMATQLVVTANLREWRHILKLRTSQYAHPQMREVMVPLLHYLRQKIPVVFDDIIGAGVVPDKDEWEYVRG